MIVNILLFVAFSILFGFSNSFRSAFFTFILLGLAGLYDISIAFQTTVATITGGGS